MARNNNLTFDLRATVGAPPVEPNKEWLPNDAKDRFNKNEYFGVSAYLGSRASCLELMASRTFYVLNGCSYYAVETFLITGLRILGWAARFAFFLLSIVFCFYSLTTTKNPILYFPDGFSRTRNQENELTTNNDPMLWFTEITFTIWIVSIVTLCLTYVIDRFSRTPHSGQCSAFTLVLFNRSPIAAGEGRCCVAAILICYFAALGVAATLVIHTCVNHAYVARNQEFMKILGILLAFDVLGATADVISIGSVDGIRVTSSTVSWLASFRFLVIIPIEVIFTCFFIVSCLPDGI